MEERQRQFTKACQLYLGLQNKLKEMLSLKSDKGLQVGEKDLLKQFDIFLQVILLYTAIADLKVLDIELSFIKLITVEEDILDTYNEKNNKEITWDSLISLSSKKNKYLQFIDETYDFFFMKINDFIIFLASVDAYTKSDYLTYFKDTLKQILLLFVNIDNQSTKEEITYIDEILEKTFLEKYNSLKGLYAKFAFL